MALTRDFKMTVRERLQSDPSFREEFLKEALSCFLASDVETGRSLLHDYAEWRSRLTGVSNPSMVRNTSA